MFHLEKRLSRIFSIEKEMFKGLSSKLLKFPNSYQNTQIRQNAVQTVQIFINGTPVTVPSFYTASQALRDAKVVVPSFCYHERLSIAGNCRMCLIEVEGAWKPQVACALNVTKNMKIRTNSETVKKAQESVLEFTLVDHPLDCPICDQGGECDLQDITVRFGNDRSRFTDIHFEGKRAVEDKTLSPLIRAEMNRCIHCTRCIRFGAQICGVEVLGSTGRGHDMLVGTFVDKLFLSELSGNIVDLCPVGALTNIPYKFKARSWELKKANSIDVTDATGTNIILNYRFDRVLRVLPREHEEINQEWVSDKGRWAIDSLEMQRLVTPMKKAGSCCCPLEWDIALKEASEIIRAVPPDSVMAIAGPHTNVETLVACKDFLNMLGCENTYVERGLNYTGSGIDLRAAYSLTINMKDICHADKILLIGTNPRFEAPILNMWIRQAYKTNEADIFVIGPKCEYNYHVTYLGDSPAALPKANEPMLPAKNPLIFVGITQLETESGTKLMNAVAKLAASLKFAPKGWGIINIVTREASFAGALEAGWKPGALEVLKKTPPKVIISLGADDVFYDWNPPTSCKIIYIGFQGDRGAEFANLILPGSAYTEAGGIYLNMECRSQFAMPAVTPPGKARQDWKIIRALAEFCCLCLFYSDHSSLCTRLVQISPNFTCLGSYQAKLFPKLVAKMINPVAGGCETLDVDMKKMADYYCSDVFTYNSPTMVKTQKAAQEFENSHYFPA
ncbi:NADH-ubiquinone oxidoreductase 75 kDa subunit, mitochondrial-like [Trichoplusia ni]|uniref:NADH-ubiquinone oxidoreductase 75 kDa subunit, mitochondrial n=1 Tax=Trichoplusia ni TaxID=7111 RepID=A0A7E5VAB5_TRINI|nr:NADH-ubiquinone oxidoreductase 75 kDa subunit, mitochondrial-like [Trichoplusia ni]